MDQLDNLLQDLAAEPLPADSLHRIRPRVESALRRRSLTRYCLATAAALAAFTIARWPQTDPTAIPLPPPVQAIIAAPDLVLSPAPTLPVSRRHPSPRPKPKAIDENTVQLASSNDSIVIYWSL
jgi:hypothetical protein